jgi:tetratricopeptide (TPR) repeat protein
VAIEINAKKAIGLEPENPDFYNTLALAYDADDLPELKVECYQKALNLPTCTPRSRVAYYGNIAVQYSYMSKYKKALVYADSALMIDSTCAFALLQKAKSEFLLDRKDSAVADINRALDVNWEEQLDKGLQFTLLYVAALIEEATQNYDESFAHVLKALEIQPSSEGAQELYARVKRRVK